MINQTIDSYVSSSAYFFYCFIPNTSPSGRRGALQDSALREKGLFGSGDRSHGRLHFRFGQVSLARGPLLEGPRWLVGLLRASQLQGPSVPAGERRLSQAHRLGCRLCHCAVLPKSDWVCLTRPKLPLWLSEWWMDSPQCETAWVPIVESWKIKCLLLEVIILW